MSASLAAGSPALPAALAPFTTAALPSALALLASLLLARPLLRELRARGRQRPNYRGRPLPVALGLLIAASGLLGLALSGVAQAAGLAAPLQPGEAPIAAYCLLATALGLLDDELGSCAGAPRGVRGHVRALLGGRRSTGVLKAVGLAALAPAALAALGLSGARLPLACCVLVLCSSAFNQLDLRPGRAAKSLTLLLVSLVLATGDGGALPQLGPFLAPALVAGALDLRERAMLGDAGASLLGALAGLWIALALDAAGLAVALAALLAVNLYGEFRSICGLVERTPLLRELDSLGRPS